MNLHSSLRWATCSSCLAAMCGTADGAPQAPWPTNASGAAASEGVPARSGLLADAQALSEDSYQAINAFDDMLDSLGNLGAGLYYSFTTAQSDNVWTGQVERGVGSWATNTTVFPLASLSKLFTALAVMRTMELKPDSFYPTKLVNAFEGWGSFSNFPVHGMTERANLTVHHLLTHTSGLPFGMRYSREDIEQQTLFFWPGTAFGYTLGHRVLGWVLRDFWKGQPETSAIGIRTVQDTFKWLIFDKLELSCSTRFNNEMSYLFGYSGEAGDAAISSTGEDVSKLAVLALRRGRLPSGDIVVSEDNWNKWAIPNLLPRGKLSEDLVSWQGAAASWENWNVGGLKATIMKQSGSFGWNYFGATYYNSSQIGWCGFFSSCLRVTYPQDLSFVIMQRNFADLEKSKPYLVKHFADMAQSLQCQEKTSCRAWERASIFCKECRDGSCKESGWSSQCPSGTVRSSFEYTSWSSTAHTCYVPRCSGAPARGLQCATDTGGTCRVFWCHASRGPTDCLDGKCICQPGSCLREGSCQRSNAFDSCCRDTQGTCNLLDCTASRGAVDCEDGRCICGKGLCAEAGHCVPPSALTLASPNMSRTAVDIQAQAEPGDAAFGLAAATAASVAGLVAAVALRQGCGRRAGDAYGQLPG